MELIFCHQRSLSSWSHIGPYNVGCLPSTLSQQTHLSSRSLSHSLFFLVLSPPFLGTTAHGYATRAACACHALKQGVFPCEGAWQATKVKDSHSRRATHAAIVAGVPFTTSRVTQSLKQLYNNHGSQRLDHTELAEEAWVRYFGHVSFACYPLHWVCRCVSITVLRNY